MTNADFALKSLFGANLNLLDLEIELDDDIPTATKVVKKRLQTLVTKTDKENLSGHQVIQVSGVQDQSKGIQKTQSVSARILIWAVNTRASIWATVKIFKSIRFGMLLGVPSQETRSQTDKSLDQLSGSIHLAKTIHSLSPAVAAWVQEKLIGLKYHESLNAFLRDEHCTLQTFVDVLLPTVYLNIAKSVKEAKDDCGANVQDPVSLVDVTSYICEIVNRHLPYINQKLDLIEKTTDLEKRDRIICHVFSRLVDEFIAIALPNGVNELPLIKVPLISQHFWKVVQKRVLPIIFYEVYRQLAIPMHQSKKDQLLQMKGGESLVSLAQMAGDQAIELLPLILAEAVTETKHEDVVIVYESPLVAIIAKSFSALLSGSDHLKNWLSSWFTKQLVGFGKSDNIDLKQLWKLLGGYLEPMFIYVCMNMSQIPVSLEATKGRIPDVIGIICIRFLSVCSRFFSANRHKIQERVEQLKLTGGNFKEDKILLSIFEPLSSDLLCMMGLDEPSKLPLPDFVKEIVVQHLKEVAPAFLLRQYFAITNSNIDGQETRRKLRTLLFDPKNLEDPAIAIKIVSAIHANKESSAVNMFNQFYDKLWQESGTERIAKTLEAMCSVSASELVNSVMQHFGVSDQTLLNANQNPFMENVNKKIKSLVETAFLEILVNIMDTVEEREYVEDGNHPKSLVAINAMLHLNSIVEKRLNGVKKELAKIAQRHSPDSEAYRQEANKLFSGLAADFHDFININPFKHLPLDEFPAGDSLKEILWTSIKNVVLPDVAHKVYLEVVEWQSKQQESYEELEKSYHSSHPRWACKVLAQYATDFIRHYLLTSHDDAAKLLLESLKSYFAESKDHSAPFVVETLNEIEGDVNSLIDQNISAIGTNQDPQLMALWPSLTRYAEAIIAKFFAEISKNIREIELENPDFTVDLATQILKDTADHFAVVTKVTEESELDQSYRVPLADILSAFGENLHDGVPLNPSDPEDVKDLVRLQGCFIPLADKLLKLANLSSQDFPLPSMLRQQMGDLVINKILPLALLRTYQKAFEPQVRNVLMLNFVQTLYAALNGVEPPRKESELEEVSSHTNPKQKQLYETCGFVVLELIKLIPDTTVQYVFMKEKVKDMSAAAIGDAIMPYLSRWTLLQMIDTTIYSGLPSFHPSKWEGKLGREDLVPRKAFVRPDGKMELKPVKEFKFDFAATPAETKLLEEQKVKEAEKVRRELRDAFTKTISQQLHAKVWAFVKSLWGSLQEQLNDFVERMFPEKGREVKAFFDKIFSKIFFDVFGSIIQFLTTPLVSLVKFVTEKTIIDRRSEDIIENLQSEALENLFYKWTDSVIDTLVRLQKKPQVST